MPKGYSEEDFIFAKLFKGVNEVGQSVMCQLAKGIYSLPLTDANNGHMPLKNYCETKSITINLNFFPNLMETDITKKSFDISAAYIIVRDICVDFYETLSEQCKTSVKDLVGMRNEICHKYGCTEEDMKRELNLLKTIIRIIHEETGKQLGNSFNIDISLAEKHIDSIINAKLQDNSSGITQNDIDNFKESLQFKMISQGRTKLDGCYSKLTVLNPCTWLGEIDYKILSKDFDHTKRSKIDKFKVDKIYTTLKIADNRSNLDVEDLLITTVRKKRKEYLPKVLLLEGQAGCGKTSLCRFLIHEWCKTLDPKNASAIKGLAKYDLVILVELRRTQSVTFEEFLRHDLLYKVCRDFKDEDFRYLLDELTLLIVIDGFDERKDDKLTKDIFQTCKNKRIILSTRTKCLDNAKSLARGEMIEFLSISICGFDYPGLKEFSEKVFQAIEDNPEKRKQELQEFQRLIDEKKHIVKARQHLEDYQLPLTIAFIIILWRDNPEVINQISTSTRLYLEIFKLFQKKLKERLCKLGKNKKLDGKLNALLLLLGDVAWKMLKEGNYLLTDNLYEYIKTECKKRSVDYMELLSAFLMCETNYNSDVDDLVFMFLHKTQMEYLAAVYLSHQILKKNETAKQIFSQAQDCQEVLLYLTGHLAIHEQLDKDIINTIVGSFKYKTDDFTFWWEFYSESLYNEEIGRLIVKKQLQREKWILSDEHIICGLRFMSNDLTRKLKDIEVDIEQEPDDIPQILEAMNDIMEPKGYIKLKFHKHYNLVNSGTSDKYLMALKPWGNLTHFVGSLCKEGCQVLPNFGNLVNISVKLSEPEAVQSLSCSLKKLKKIRNLRVRLPLPPGCHLPDSVDLYPCDSLEVWLPSMSDENKEWMVKEVLNKVAAEKGCNRVHLPNSELTFKALMWIVENLQVSN